MGGVGKNKKVDKGIDKKINWANVDKIYYDGEDLSMYLHDEASMTNPPPISGDELKELRFQCVGFKDKKNLRFKKKDKDE